MNWTYSDVLAKIMKDATPYDEVGIRMAVLLVPKDRMSQSHIDILMGMDTPHGHGTELMYVDQDEDYDTDELNPDAYSVDYYGRVWTLNDAPNDIKHVLSILNKEKRHMYEGAIMVAVAGIMITTSVHVSPAQGFNLGEV